MDFRCEWASQFLMSEITCSISAVMYAMTERAWRKRREGPLGGIAGAFLCQAHADEMLAFARIDLRDPGDAAPLVSEYENAAVEFENATAVRKIATSQERADLGFSDWWQEALERRMSARLRLADELRRRHTPQVKETQKPTEN